MPSVLHPLTHPVPSPHRGRQTSTNTVPTPKTAKYMSKISAHKREVPNFIHTTNTEGEKCLIEQTKGGFNRSEISSVEHHNYEKRTGIIKMQL